MILRPTLRYCSALIGMSSVALVVFAIYQYYAVSVFIEEFEHQPLPASAAVHDAPDGVRADEPSPATGERGVDREVEPMPAWSWTDETVQNAYQHCDGEMVHGCEPPVYCDGIQTTRSFEVTHPDSIDVHGELWVVRRSPGASLAATCKARVDAAPGTALRVQHLPKSTIIYGRSSDALYQWQYDLDCQLVDSRQLMLPIGWFPDSPHLPANETRVYDLDSDAFLAMDKSSQD